MEMFNLDDYAVALRQLSGQLEMKEAALADVERSLKLAANAVGPLADGEEISVQSQISLAAIAFLAIQQAQTAVGELRNIQTKVKEAQVKKDKQLN
jgi:hypothetical protein